MKTLILCSVALLAWSCCTARADDAVDESIGRAATLLTKKDRQEFAKILLEKALARPFTSAKLKAEAKFWLAYRMLWLQEGDLGESRFRELLKSDPKEARVHFNLALICLAKDRFPEMIEHLQITERGSPDLWMVEMLKGRAFAALGKSKEARKAFETAIRLSPDTWIAHVYAAVFLGLPDGYTVLQKMLTRDPNYSTYNAPPLGFYTAPVDFGEYLDAFEFVTKDAKGEEKEIGKLYLQYLQRSTTGAGFSADRRIENPSSTAGLVPKVLALKIAVDRDDSPEKLKTALARLPENLSDFGSYAYVLRAEARDRLGQLEDALSDIQAALTIDPKSAIGNWMLARLQKKANRKSEALATAKNLVSLHPGYAPGTALLAELSAP